MRWVKRDIVFTDNGPYYKPGRYYIERALFDRWVAERRDPGARHDFDLSEPPTMHPEQPHWGSTRHTTCRRCGERREVWWLIDKHDLDSGGWCVSLMRRSRVDKWLRRVTT